MIEKAPGESQGLFAFIFKNMQEWERYLDGLLEWAGDNPPTTRAGRVVDLLIKGGHKLYLLPRQLKYTMVRKKTEAFFERGRLYQVKDNGKIKDLALYSLADIEFAIEEGNRGDYTPFLLKKAPRYIKPNEVFMMIDIKRYRHDYCIMKVLAGDQTCGMILYGNNAMFPMEVFTDITE